MSVFQGTPVARMVSGVAHSAGVCQTERVAVRVSQLEAVSPSGHGGRPEGYQPFGLAAGRGAHHVRAPRVRPSNCVLFFPAVSSSLCFLTRTI